MSLPSPRPRTGLQRLPEANSLPEVAEALREYAGRDADILFTQRRALREAMSQVLPRVPQLQDSYDALLPFLINGHDAEKAIAAFRVFVDDILTLDTRPSDEDIKMQSVPIEPSPSPDLLGPDAALLRTILDHPGDDGPRLVYADHEEERGGFRSELLRLEYDLRRTDLSLADRERLERRRREAGESHLHQTLERFAIPPITDREAFPQKTLDDFAKLSPDVQVLLLQTLLRLPEQYADVHRLLRDHGLIAKNAEGIEGFAGQSRPDDQASLWYALPSYDDVLRRLQEAAPARRLLLFQKSLQGFTRFLVVPLHPVPVFMDALRADINARRTSLACTDDDGNLHLLNSREKPIAADPVWLWHGWEGEEALTYPLDGGEAEPLANIQRREQGFRLMLVEDMANTPHRDARPLVLAGREQIRGGRTGAAYHALLSAPDAHKPDPQYRGEREQMLQAHLLSHLLSLTRGILPDTHPTRWTESWCTGSQSSGRFGNVFWNRGVRRLVVYGDHPDFGGDGAAPRSSVGV